MMFLVILVKLSWVISQHPNYTSDRSHLTWHENVSAFFCDVCMTVAIRRQQFPLTQLKILFSELEGKLLIVWKCLVYVDLRFLDFSSASFIDMPTLIPIFLQAFICRYLFLYSTFTCCTGTHISVLRLGNYLG